MSKRRTHSPELKTRIAMEAISGHKTNPAIADDHDIHPIKVSLRKPSLVNQTEWAERRQSGR